MAEEGGDFDSWEDQADSGIFDKRLDEMSAEIQQSEKKKILTKSQVVLSEECSATQYQPQVRILKRDTKASSSDGQKQNSPVSASSKTNKTLQQREAEYAEARMRIFGCVPPDDDGNDCDANANGNEINTNNSSVMIQGVPQIFKASNNPISVIRQPRGPDGTNGFNKPDHT